MFELLLKAGSHYHISTQKEKP